MPLPEQNAHYTYEDYCKWDDGKRWELIEGVPYAMSPAPTNEHQTISMELSGQFYNFLKGKPCKAFAAPFDVRLFADKNDEDDTVVQPDLVVVCDRSKLDGTGCKGAPDFVIEILSPSSGRHDRLVKYNLYQNAGVREYWIIDPADKLVTACVLENGRYLHTLYSDEDVAPVAVLPGCEINLGDVFAL